MIHTPPIEPLHEMVARLEGAGLVCALGGSGMLAAFGLVESVRDWDVTTDAPLDRVHDLFRDLEPDLYGSSGIHADHKLVLRNGEIEVIVGFAMHGERGVIHLPTIVTESWRGVPLGSPEVWAVAYTLLGREEKATMLFEWMGRSGADRAAIARITAEPLDASLQRRLTALPLRDESRLEPRE